MPSDSGLFREEAFARRGQREPIDGLLRVTAPHEWVILLGLVLALGATAAWGLFGSVERSLGADCALVQPDERYAELGDVQIPDDAVGGFEAMALVPRHDARRLEAGMEARVSASQERLDGPEVLDAEVVGISERPVVAPGWLPGSEGSASPGGHAVRLALRSALPTGVADGDHCTVRIVLDRHAPARWLTSTWLG